MAKTDDPVWDELQRLRERIAALELQMAKSVPYYAHRKPGSDLVQAPADDSTLMGFIPNCS